MTVWSSSSIQFYLGEPLSWLGWLGLLTWEWEPERSLHHQKAYVRKDAGSQKLHSSSCSPGWVAKNPIVFLAEGPLELSIFLSFLSLRNLCFFPPGGRISDSGRCKCSAHFSQRKTCLPMKTHAFLQKHEAPVRGWCEWRVPQISTQTLSQLKFCWVTYWLGSE